MATHTTPTLGKIDVLEAVKSGVMVYPKAFWLGDYVLAINVGLGDFGWMPETAEVQYAYCVRGTVHCEFKHGDEALTVVDVKAGELLTVPAGFATRGTASDDNVTLVFERAKPPHV